MDVRAFISIPININDDLSELLGDLKKCQGIRVPPASQMHITLKFIGDVNINKLKKIQNCIDSSVSDIVSSPINLKGIGTFPERKDPKIVWVGIESDLPLAGISSSISKGLDELGIACDEKPFKPHMTVGRIQGKTDIIDILVKYKDEEFLTFTCDHIDLMKSELTPKGAIHSIISTAKLH